MENSLPRKLWKIKNKDTSRSIIDILLENRNLPTNHMEPFRLTDRMHKPELLPDMEKGVQRILQAINNNEKIVIFGDYDVDGVTSTSLMLFFFKAINYPVQYIVPHREKDGYGLRNSGVDRVNAMAAKLIITVDNGISANDAIDYASSLGIDVVVTDHHLQEGELPNACAVINPNRTDSTYPFKAICGVTVAFKVAWVLGQRLMSEDEYKKFLLSHLDLVAIGTIADVMPIRDENYALVKFGLKVLSNTKKPGLIELKKISGVRTNIITPITVGYFLAPRLNASGRMDDASLSVDLLVEESSMHAKTLAQELDALNKERQMLQRDYLENATKDIKASFEDDQKIIIVENEEWQAGLIGLVSGRLKEEFCCPALAFTRDGDGNFVGSARSIEALHVTEALTVFNQYFLNYGGHHKAAGLTIPAEHFSIFKEEFTSYVNKKLAGADLTPELDIDSVVEIDQINERVADKIQEVGPFGETNPEPVLLLKNGTVRDVRIMSEGRHIKFYIQKANIMFECLWWSGGIYKDSLRLGSNCDVVFRMNINVFQGTPRLQLTVEDVQINN
ncbi:MAG: single-stranded-DNA-specific exonuclease RecJ [Calditrichaeota bacterium]|nr:MAG: single-stranded-DNA-specific exonuclease RecJ [Calditrichota bacterium]MBL1207118.1 single-stranded-DNA-specific exonuclease RecJ [Calditrichota bacterium]NOG46948.1 single-stranded-DNA-specific exonuclease RecJ [Calditrichota bacterium]